MDIVTGAFSYTGRFIVERLLQAGRQVKTLTGHPERAQLFGHSVEAHPLDFDRQPDLARFMEGAATLYNTYWVRFKHGGTTFDQAVANSRTLLAAARQAGIQRVVHVSITNPSDRSSFPYFRGKAQVEEAVASSDMSYGIVRPSVVYGGQDILISNIAWLLRRFPIFIIPGDGAYQLQPVHVEDVADLCVHVGQQRENSVIDAVGPEIYSFNELIREIASALGRRPRVAHLPPPAVLPFMKVVGWMVRDVVLTSEELHGMMANLCVSAGLPTGNRRLSLWLKENAATLGRGYRSELERHYR